MKILFIVDFYDDGQLYQEPLLAKKYIDLGHEVFVFTSHNTDVFKYINEEKIENKQLKIYRGKNGENIYRFPYRINLLKRIKSFPNLTQHLKSISPDLVFFHDISFNMHEVVNWKKKYKPNLKIIMDYHADYSNSGKNWLSINILHKVIRKGYFHKFLKHIDKIYPIVPEGIRFLKEVYSIPEKNMELLPLGVDLALINEIKDKTDRKMSREKFGLSANKIIIATGGKLNEIKRTDVAIKMMEKLPSNVHLVVYGKAFTDEFGAYLQKLTEGKNVSFTGWLNLEETIELLLCSDIAVYPASQSVLWQQSIGCGLPVVAGDSGGQDMEYLNRHNNLVKVNVENINPEYFAKTVWGILNDQERFVLMKEGAKKTVEEFLDYKILALKTIAL